MAHGLFTPDPRLALHSTHLSIRRGRATTTHYTHNGVAQHYLVPSLRLRIWPACEAGLSVGMRRERVPPQIRKKEKIKEKRRQETDITYPDIKQ